MRKSLLGQIGLLAIAGMAMTACTSTQSRITTTYYNISGATGEDLDREIASKGPLKGHALASAAIKFVPVTVSYDRSNGHCRYHEAKFRIEANLTLPRWREHVRSSNPELRTAWKYLAAYAREHEEEHVAIAERFARKIGEGLEAIPARDSCDALDAVAERLLKRYKREHNRAQLAFDAAEQKRLSNLFD